MCETNLERGRVKTNSMENYRAYQRCYNQYVSYYKQCFPLRLALSLSNGQKKKQIIYLGLCRSSTSNAKSKESATASTIEAEHDILNRHQRKH